MSNNPFENQSIKKERLFFLVLVVCIVFTIFIGYLFSMQVTRGMEFQNRAWAVARRTSEVPALRGEIYDRNYDTPLASNVDSFAVSIVPAETDRQKLPQIIADLAVILGTDAQVLMKKIPQADVFQSIELKDNVSYGQVVQIASNIEDFPGISWSSKPIRHYNHTASLSHVIGYVGNINTEELQLLYNKGYAANSIIGKNGIEKEYDLLLFLAEHPEGAVICVENVMENDPELILSILRRVDDPRLRMCLDVGHANLSTVDPADWIRQCAPFISHYHIHNNNGAPKEGQPSRGDLHRALGNGIIDMEAILRKAEELTPDATAAIESYEPEASVEWLKEHRFI